MFARASKRAGGQETLRPLLYRAPVKNGEAINRREAADQASQLNLINLDDNCTYVEHRLAKLDPEKERRRLR